MPQIHKKLCINLKATYRFTARNRWTHLKTNLKKQPIAANPEALEAFEKIKNSLISDEVILSHPDFEKEFELTTDASDYAIGAALSQNCKPITFISRSLSTTEEHLATNEKEMLAIIWALGKCRNYLYGSKKVKIVTDHQPLTYSLSNRNTNNKMKRWKAILEEYNYELEYRPGKMNVVHRFSLKNSKSNKYP